MAYGSTLSGGAQNPGGYNRIPIKVEYVGLKDYPTIQFLDDSPFSDSYFNIVDFPTKLTAGKNLFKLKASSGALVKNAQIHIEVLDSNGNPIYYEVLKYFESDGTRVVTIHVTDDTPPGVATVYVASRIKNNPDSGTRIPFSRDFASTDYFNYPNLLWSRTVTVGPNELNSSEIIFTRAPSVRVAEVVQPFFQPRTRYNVFTEKFGGGRYRTEDTRSLTVRVKAASQTVYTEVVESADIVTVQYTGENGGGQTQQNNRISLQASTEIVEAFSDMTTSEEFFDPTMVGATITIPNPKVQIPGLSPIYTPGSTTPTRVGAFIDADGRLVPGLDGTNPASNPSVANVNNMLKEPYSSTNPQPWLWALTGSDSASDKPYPFIGNKPGYLNELSGSARFQIINVLNATKARVVYEPTNGKFAEVLTFKDVNGDIQQQTITRTFDRLDLYNPTSPGPSYGEPNQPNYYHQSGLSDSDWNLPSANDPDLEWIKNTNFTASWVEPFVTDITQQSQSFAQITVANIEPAAGDVYKIRTSYKPGGMFGNYIDAGETIVERVEILVDTGSFETDSVNGTFHNRIGYFTNMADFSKYWTGSHSAFDSTDSGIGTPTALLSDNRTRRGIGLAPTYNPFDLMGGIQLYPSGGFGMPELGGYLPYGAGGDFAFVCLKDQYQVPVRANTSYVLSFRALSKDSKIDSGSTFTLDDSFNPNILHPYNHLNIYMSASAGHIEAAPGVLERYRGPSTSEVDRILEAATLTSDGYFGDYIGHSNYYTGPNGWTTEDTQIGRVLGNIITPLGYGEVVDYNMEFTATQDALLNMFIVPRRGIWVIADISIKTLAETGYTPNFAQINLRIPTQYYNTPLTFKFEYLNYMGGRANLDTVVYPVFFAGDNTVINGNSNLLSGSLFVSNQIGTGLEIAGAQSGYVRSTGYQGFKSASRTDQPGGFLMYSGSVLPGTPDNYQGVGLELVRDSASFFRFKTDGNDAGLEVRTDKFFLGSDTSQFISGSGGLFEISSDNFVLSSAGNVTGSNMLLTGNAKADILEYKHLDITRTNSGSYLNTFIYGGKYYYELDLSTDAAMFIRFDFDAGDIKYPIARINPPSGDDQNRSQTVYLECADNPGGLPLSAPSFISGEIELKLDPGDLLEQSFVTTTWGGSSYDRTYIVPTGCRVMCIRSKFDWKIQSMNNFKTATASFGALHLGDDTIITTATPDIDGGSF